MRHPVRATANCLAPLDRACVLLAGHDNEDTHSGYFVQPGYGRQRDGVCCWRRHYGLDKYNLSRKYGCKNKNGWHRES